MPARPPHHVTCLGVGDGHADPQRGHAAFLYEFGPVRVLVDCGEPATRALLRAGFGLDTLDAVLVSHLHFDHVGGLFTLLQALWLSGRQRPLVLHLPATGLEPVQNLMAAARLFQGPPPFPLRWEVLRPGQPVPVGPLTVTPLPSSHLRVLAGRSGRKHAADVAYSFLLHTAQVRVGHSADLGGGEDIEPLIQEPLDLLVCELAHLEPPALFARLCGQPIRRLALVHLSAEQWRQRRLWQARARRALSPIPVCIPRDGTQIEF